MSLAVTNSTNDVKLDLVGVQNQASMEKFHYFEAPMYRNFEKCWIVHSSLSSLKKEFPILEIRSRVLEQIGHLPQLLSSKVSEHERSYAQRKATIPCSSIIEKNLNDCAMDNMTQIFVASYKNPLIAEGEKIGAFSRSVNEHFGRFRDLLENPTPESAKVAEQLIADVHSVRRNLNLSLIQLANRSAVLAQELIDLANRGEKIGPAFNVNPAAFLKGMPLLVTEKSGLLGKKVTEVVQEIEGIKQKKCVAQGAEPFYLLLLNATQALRKLEKGMAKCLANQFNVHSGFELDHKLSSLSLSMNSSTKD